MDQLILVKSLSGKGLATATTADGQIRTLRQGDTVFYGETLNTSGQVSLTLVDEDGEMVLSMGANAQVLLDESVTSSLKIEDTIVKEVEALQAALEQGEELPDEETAAGEEDPFLGSSLDFYEGDRSSGDVDPRLLGIDPPEEIFSMEDTPELLAQDPIESPEINGYNFIVELDISHSMTGGMSTIHSKLENMIEMAQEMAVEKGGPIRITIQTFSKVASDSPIFIEFEQTETGLNIRTHAGDISESQLGTWVDSHIESIQAGGIWTNYEAALEGANAIVSESSFAQNHVIFISDGNVNGHTGFPKGSGLTDYYDVADLFGVATEGSKDNPYDKKIWDSKSEDIINEVFILGENADSVRVIGIGVESIFEFPELHNVIDAQGNIVDILDSDDLLNAMDTTGQSKNLSSAAEIDLANMVTNTVEQLQPVGSDAILGAGGDDMIDGGSGVDTLLLGADSSLDFSGISNIEKIQFSDEDQSQTISLTADQVLSMSSGNNLDVIGNFGGGDKVVLDKDWDQVSSTNVWEAKTGETITAFSVAIIDQNGVVTTYDDQGNIV